MRKSSRLLLFLLLVTVTGAVAAEESKARIDATRSGARFSFVIRLEEAPVDAIVSALHDGMRSEVEYRVQLYRRTGGLLGLFGDRLVEEYETRYIAYFDPFTRSYRIDASGSFKPDTRSFEDTDAFLEAFLSVQSRPVKLPVKREKYWLRGRSILKPVRTAPPLGLMGLFLPSERHRTSWSTAEF